MPKPEGYRKAIRVMQMAAKFSRPVITLLDTPGAYPESMPKSAARPKRSPATCARWRGSPAGDPVCIGEGGSGGALAFGVGNRVYMLENAVYSVISPESCAAIIWRDSEKAELAAAAFKITASELLAWA